MVWRRITGFAGWTALAALLGLALWFRVTSLSGYPEPNGDEALFGIQTYHLVHGDPVAMRTPTGNPSNPAVVAVQAPMLLAFGPQYWVLRAPTVFFGVLAVACAFAWGRRWADGPTAVLAASALAVMPMAVIVARGSIESGVSPFFALLAVHQAFVGRRLGVMLAFSLALAMHPTNLFLAPMVALVYLGRTLPKVERGRWWRVLAEVAAGSALILGAYGLFTLRRSGSAVYYTHPSYRPPDLLAFLASLPRYLIGQPYYLASPIPAPWLRRFDLLFWATLAAVAVPGLWALARRKAWGRLGLVAGFAVGVLGFQRVAGADVLVNTFHRYGAFLIAPAALVGAVLGREVLFTRPGPLGGPSRARALPVAVALVMAAGALWTFKVRHFDGTDPRHAESVWTLRTEKVGPLQGVYDRIKAEVDRDRAAGDTRVRGVIAEDWWVGRPIEYLALDRPDVKVLMFEVEKWRTTPERLDEVLAKRVAAGDFLVERPGLPGGLGERARRVVGAGRLTPDAFQAGGSTLTVVRQRSGPDVPQVARRPSAAETPTR